MAPTLYQTIRFALVHAAPVVATWPAVARRYWLPTLALLRRDRNCEPPPV